MFLTAHDYKVEFRPTHELLNMEMQTVLILVWQFIQTPQNQPKQQWAPTKTSNGPMTII